MHLTVAYCLASYAPVPKTLIKLIAWSEQQGGTLVYLYSAQVWLIPVNPTLCPCADMSSDATPASPDLH